MALTHAQIFSDVFTDVFGKVVSPKTSEYWDEDYQSFLVGAELLTGTGTDFFNTVQSPWAWGGSDYSTGGGVLGANKYMQEPGMATVGGYYRTGLTIANYQAGTLALYAGANISSAMTANGTYHFFREQTINQDYLVYGYANCDIDNVSGFTLKEQTEGIGTGSWSAYNTCTLDIDEESLFVYCDGSSASGALIYLRDSNDLISDLEVDKTYTYSITAKVSSGATLRLALYNGAAVTYSANIGESWETIEMEFIAKSTNGCLTNFSNMSDTETVWFKDLSLVG